MEWRGIIDGLMEIHQPELSYRDNKAVLSSRFTCRGKENTLWFRFDKELADHAVLEKSDAFLVALLYLAMNAEEDIHLNHPVSEEIYYNITEYLIPLLELTVPRVKRISVFASGFSDISRKGTSGVVATGLSCGIDSLCTIARHLRKEVPMGHRITHCVFMDVGSHGRIRTGSELQLFSERFAHSSRLASELGLRTIVIESNLAEILPGEYLKTHSLRNVAAILALEKLFSIYYYSAGESNEYLGVGSISNCEPLVLSYLSTKNLTFVSSGAQFRRTEKTRIVSEFEPSYRYLNVCTKTANNCSVCEKCLRTEVTLDLLGKLELYDRIFDLEKFRQIRTRYLCFVRATKATRTYSKEILDLMKERGQRFGFVLSCFYPGYKMLYTALELIKGTNLYAPGGRLTRIIDQVEKKLL